MIIDIESDNRDVNEMVLAAKCNRWERVYPILRTKPYLINCIPEERAWSALHQAVYWNNATIVTNLLGYETCDAMVKSKECLDEMIPPHSTASDLAKLKHSDEIDQLLTANIKNHRLKRFGDVPRFVTKIEGQQLAEIGFPLFVLEVVMYKNTLLDHNGPTQNHSVNLLRRIFNEEEHNWPSIETKLYQTMYGHCKNAADEIREAHAENEASFFRKLINLYTGVRVYAKVNEALGREFLKDYRPAADELAVGLYALLLDVTITFWNVLEKFDETTYRGVGINVTDKYIPGDEIMFTTIVSCSRCRQTADGFRHQVGTLFVFNNSRDSSYRPRKIEAYSIFAEQECVYVLGTSFKVDGVDINARTVSLSLL